jgi:cation diffusion facilitator family transporter
MAINIFKKVKQVLWIILFANLSVALLKIVIGTAVKSSSMTADGFHSLTDGSSNIIGIIGISLAAKPVDKDHPYGHRKFETLSALAIAGMLLVVGGKIMIEAITRFSNPVVPEITIESLIILLITLIINIFVSSYEYKQGKKLNSYILTSDSLHTRSDIFVSIGVIITLLCVKLGLSPIIDTIASLIVSLLIFHASYEIFKSTSGVLVDKAVVDTDKIKELTLEFEEVKGVHNIRSRGSENEVYIDMHILTEPHMSIEQSHNLIHGIEKRMQREINNNLQVFVHIEPFYEKLNKIV